MVLLAFHAFGPDAVGRLGESLPQLARRFGPPDHADTEGNNVVECHYRVRNGNYEVQVTLQSGYSVSELYFSTQPLQPNGEPPVGIVRGILQTNVPHARWLDKPTGGGHEDAAFITADGRYGAWISNNGAWHGPGCTFVVAVYRADAGPAAMVPQPATQVETAPSPVPTSPPLDPAVRAQLATDFHAGVAQLLAKTDGQPWLKTPVDSITKIPVLPSELAEILVKVADNAREFRRKIGYDEKSLHDYKEDMAVVDALMTINEASHQVHSGNAVLASATVDAFSQEYPTVPGPQSKQLMGIVDSLRKLLNRLHEEANSHITKASALSDAGKSGSAVEEYQKAYDIFPALEIAAQIKKLREESLGL